MAGYLEPQPFMEHCMTDSRYEADEVGKLQRSHGWWASELMAVSMA